MRRPAVLMPMLIAAILLAAAHAQEDAAKPEEAKARPKITQDEITDLKLAHYEVERTEVKYQPYIITYDDQELVQLEYDTRTEAQARVDEINTEDRLDKLGVEGKQNKKVGIREVRASAHFLVDGKDFTESGRNPEKGFDLQRRQEATAGKSGKHGASSAIPDPLQDP